MLSYPALILAFLQLGGGHEGETLTQSFQHYGEKACALARADKAADATLERDIYLPVAEALGVPLRSAFGGMATKPGAPSTPQAAGNIDETLNKLSSHDSAMQTNAGGAVADTIRDRYREAYLARHHDTPALPSFHDGVKPQGPERAKISEDIRLYCGKLKEMGITTLFSESKAVTRPDSP